MPAQKWLSSLIWLSAIKGVQALHHCHGIIPDLISLPPFHLYSLAPPPSLPTSAPLFFIFTSVLTPPQMSCSVSPWRSKTQSLYLYPFRLSAQDFDHFALNSGKENKVCAPQPKATEVVEITALLYAYLWTRVQKWVCQPAFLFLAAFVFPC